MHLGDGQTFVATWTTFTTTSKSIVEFGTDPETINVRSYGHEEIFVDGTDGTERTEYIHRVIFPQLTPKQQYCKLVE